MRYSKDQHLQALEKKQHGIFITSDCSHKHMLSWTRGEELFLCSQFDDFGWWWRREDLQPPRHTACLGIKSSPSVVQGSGWPELTLRDLSCISVSSKQSLLFLTMAEIDWVSHMAVWQHTLKKKTVSVQTFVEVLVCLHCALILSRSTQDLCSSVYKSNSISARFSSYHLSGVARALPTSA